MKLPNGERALIDRDKLLDYSLAPEHDEGKHKARLFEALLGIDRDNAEILFTALDKVAIGGEATIGKLDRYGQRYVIDFAFSGPAEARQFARPGSSAMTRILPDW